MIEVRQTEIFDKWLDGLRDGKARTAIALRLVRLEFGNLGDCKPVGEGVLELRIHQGPGYRIYLAQRGSQLIVVLAGGDKSSQAKDIVKAKKIARELE